METETLTLKQYGPRTAYLVTEHDNPLLKIEPASSAGAADFDGLAARLVRAVNAHDALVLAVQVILDTAEIDADDARIAMDALAQIRGEARAALKLAEGREG